MRKEISSASPYEKPIGFSRACRIGNRIAVSGTAPVKDGKAAFPGDLYRQTKYCLQIALKALNEAGGEKKDVIRTRIMLTDISRWQEAARAHGECFNEYRPASTFMEVKGLIDPEWLVELEMEAQLSGENADRSQPDIISDR